MDSAENVLLKCVNALELVPESCCSIKHLADGKIYCCLISLLNKENVVGEDLAALTPRLESLFQDHFSGNPITFSEAVAGNCLELSKLTLLLLYITLVTEAKLRSRLVNSDSLDQTTQAKLKYLLEAVQKRGSAVNSRFLHILCTEKLDIRSILQYQSTVNHGREGSPHVYTTSPKSSITSPLRELVQSPQFRLQENISAKNIEIKRLQQQVMALEGEKQETFLTLEAANYKITKLEEKVKNLQSKLQTIQQQQDESEALVVAGDSLRQQQVSQLTVECSQLRRENGSLQQTVERLNDEKDELTAKNSSVHQKLLLIRAENERLQENILSLNQAKYENERLIENQADDIKEMKTQLEELHLHLMENKGPSVSIEESFGNVSLSHYSAISSPGVSGEENMADAVVDKILWEHKEQLQKLQQEFDAVTAQRDKLMEQVTTEAEEIKRLVDEVRGKTASGDSLKQELKIANETIDTLMGDKLTLTTSLQEKGKYVEELKEEINKAREQLSEEKDAFNNQVKVMEEDFLNTRMKMESDIHLLTEEIRKENKEKEDFAALYKDKNDLLQAQAEEKSQLLKAIEKKNKSLDDLQQKYDNMKNQHVSESDKLKSDLDCSQDSCSKLMKELCEVRENLNAKIVELTRDVQEKTDNLCAVKEELVGMKVVSEDLVKKYESEIQTLSVSLEGEKQCAAQAKKDVDALIDTNSKYSENIESLRESNAELTKEITELKVSLEAEKQCAAQAKKDADALIDTNSKYSDNMESLRESNAELNKEITELKVSLEAEKQCTAQAKKDADALIDTNSKYSDNMESLRESNAELNKEITELKDNLINVNEKYMMLEQQSEEAAKHYKDEISGLEEKFIKQGEAHAALQKKMETQEQMSEKDKLSFETSLQEKDRYIDALKEEMNKEREQMSEEKTAFETKVKMMKDSLNMHMKVESDIQTLTEEKIKEIEEKEHLATALKEKDSLLQIFTEEKYELMKAVEERNTAFEILQQKLENLVNKFISEENKQNSDLVHVQTDKGRVSLEQEMYVMSSNAEERLTTHWQSVTDLHKAQEGTVGRLTTGFLHKQEALIASLNHLATRKAEEKQSSHIRSLEHQIADMQKELTASKEVMRVESEAQNKLKEQLLAAKEELKHEKKSSDKIKMAYKTTMKKFSDQIEEWNQIKKERDLISKKYETAKKKLGEAVSSLDEARTTNMQYQQQLSEFKNYIKELEEKIQDQKAAQSRLQEVESKYQPVKEKLHKCENTIRQLSSEKRSLEMQLKHAEGQLQEQKRIQRRESFWEQESHLPSQRVEAHRPTISSSSSSSSNEEYWGINDSTEKLISKKSGNQGHNTKDIVFRKPNTRAKSSTSVREGGHQHESAPTIHTKVEEPPPPALPVPEIILDKSLGKSIPKSMHFRCDEEEEELFNNKYLHDMKVGKWHADGDEPWRRLSELQRRNSLYPPHLRSTYPAEMQFRPLDDFEDDKLREGCAVEDRQLMNITQATENLELDSPAFNLRKRKSPSGSSYSETSFDSSDGKRTRRLSTSYSRPGPPTPGRRFSRGDKENRRESSTSELSLSLWQHQKKEGLHMAENSINSAGSNQSQLESGRVTRRRQVQHSKSGSTQSHSSSPGRSPSIISKKGMTTPRGRKGMTPSSLRKILAKGKSPWRKLEHSEETPKGLRDSTNSNASSKLRMFRKPFSSRNYNVQTASLRSQENSVSLDNSLASSSGAANSSTETRARRRR